MALILQLVLLLVAAVAFAIHAPALAVAFVACVGVVAVEMVANR